jgi:branched-chain amino acid transport system permease protein
MLFWGIFVFSDNFLRELTKDQPLKFFGVTVMQKIQVGAINYMFIGVGLMLLMAFRPQGLFGNRKEMALDAR